MENIELLEEYLLQYIKKLRSREIYDHGYPEARLIPSNHFKECQESFINDTIEEVSSTIKEILESEILTQELKYDEY